jgi:hypothetical protein
VLVQRLTPQPGGPGYLSSSDLSPLSCPARETLPVAIYRRHSSRDPRGRQAQPPGTKYLRQGGDTFDWVNLIIM